MLRIPASIQVVPHGGGWRFTESTGMKFNGACMNTVLNEIASHRKAMKLDMSYGWEDRVMHEMCQQSPDLRCKDNPRAEGYEPLLVVEGRRRWLELHSKAILHESLPDPQIDRWYQEWVNRIPNYEGCNCRDKFKLICAGHPPIFTPEGMKDWAVLVHNLVNEGLGKPIFTP